MPDKLTPAFLPKPVTKKRYKLTCWLTSEDTDGVPYGLVTLQGKLVLSLERDFLCTVQRAKLDMLAR